MDHEPTSKPLPEKVVRRHAEILTELIPELRQKVIDEGCPADGLLSRYLRAHRELGSRDRRFLSQAVFSYFRWYGWTVNRLALPVAEACVLGAALDSTVLGDSFKYLEKQCDLPCPVEPLGDRTLTEKASILANWFRDVPRLEISDLVLADFERVIDPEKALPGIECFQQRPPTWIRLRKEPDAIIEALKKHEVPCSGHPGMPEALSMAGGTRLAKVLSGHTAQYVVQDIASQCVAPVCSPKPGDDWWDCCAGAGGKALHLMDLMQQEGKVLASDVRIASLKQLKKRARRYGIRGIRTQPYNAVSDEPFNKTFDGILVDAPCSGWGTWARNPDARWRSSRRDVTQCANRQLKILNNVSWCTRPGGTLVYAVCTFTRPETEEVVAHFLDQNSEFELDPFLHPLTGKQTEGQIQIWPWEGPGDALFIARFVRAANDA